jgi:hypothetical protein
MKAGNSDGGGQRQQSTKSDNVVGFIEFLLQLRDLSGQSNDLSMLVDFGFPTAGCYHIGIVRARVVHE